MAAPNPFIENLPSGVQTRLEKVKPPDEPVLIQVTADMVDERSFGERWLVVTERRLLLIPSEGTAGTVHVPMEEVRAVNTETLVGAGRLEVERREGQPANLHYSSSLAPKFAEVADGIRRLSKGESLSLPTEFALSRCPRCGRLLVEKGGICPACIRKWHTFGRILGYMMAYKGRVFAMVVLTAAGTVIGLAPPKITQHLIDDVLTGDVLTTRSRVDLLFWFVLGLFGLNLLIWATEVGTRWMSRWLGHRAIQAVRSDLYRQLQFLPLRFYDKRKIGALISRMTNDSDRLEAFMVFEISFLISNVLRFFGILGRARGARGRSRR